MFVRIHVNDFFQFVGGDWVVLREATEEYRLLQNGEAWLLGAHITPLATASTHITPEPTRSRKLLLNRRELDRLTPDRRMIEVDLVAETERVRGLEHEQEPVRRIPGGHERARREGQVDVEGRAAPDLAVDADLSAHGFG